MKAKLLIIILLLILIMVGIVHERIVASRDKGLAVDWNADHEITGDVDMDQHSWKNQVIENLGAFPAGPVEGQVVYRSDLNNYYCYDGTTWRNLIAFETTKMRATRGTAQTIPHNTITKIQYNTEVFDTLNEYDNITNYRLTASKSGYYHVTASILFGLYDWAAQSGLALRLYRNGNHYSNIDTHRVEETITTFEGLRGSDTIYLNVGDYIDIRVIHDRGADTDLLDQSDNNYFTAHRLS